MPKLVFHDSDGIDRTVDLGADPMLIGRATECQVQTQDAMVSRRHARIVWDGGYWIEDLGSSNGVYVGNERVQRSPLRPGDEVRCGSLILRLVPDLARPSGTPPRPMVDLNADPNRKLTGGFPSTVPPPPQAGYGDPPAASFEPGPSQDFGGPSDLGVPLPASDLAPPYQPPPPYEPPYEDAGSRPRTAASVPPPNDVQEERRRRVQAEEAVLKAEQRASTAESKLFDLETQVGELTARAEAAERKTADANERARQLEAAAREASALKRQVDQLKADLRRARGGAAEDPNAAREVGGNAELSQLAAEREALKARVSELEKELSRAARDARGSQTTGPTDVAVPGELAQLKRKVEQLTAENRRLRGGATAPPRDEEDTNDQSRALARLAELETRLSRAEQERDDAMRRAELSTTTPVAPAARDDGELERARRTIEQLTAENRRMRQGAPSQGTGSITAVDGKSDPAAAAAAAGINDALDDLRASLRAASDEVAALAVSAPGDSVTVLRESLGSASEQLESARSSVRDLRKTLKVG